MKRAAGFLVLFLAATPAAAEPVRVEARAVPAKATLGAEIKLFVTVDRPRDYVTAPPPAKAVPPPFEVKRVDVLPPVGKNRVLDTFVLTLTAFELGTFTVPALPVGYRDENGPERVARTPEVRIEIVSVAGKIPEQAQLKPIKGPVSVARGAVRDAVLGSVAALLAAALVFRAVRRRLGRPKPDPDALKPPHERAALELERLDKAGYESESKWKELYAGFSGVVRRYLERGFGFDASDRTTSEILADMKTSGKFHSAALERAREILETADLVKFAKFTPDRETTARAKRAILDFVQLTKPEEAETPKRKGKA